MSTAAYTSALLLYLMGGAWCQGTATIELSSNPVYSGELVVLTCRFGEDNTLSFVTIDAFNHTREEGQFWCRVPRPNVTAYGVFSGIVMSGCPHTIAGSPNVSLSMTASPSLELDFRCTTIVTNVDYKQYTLTSDVTSLVVYVLPSTPKFAPNPLVFNEGETANIVCESHNGKPASAVILTVSSLNGTRRVVSGIGSASLSLSPPLTNWHNATAICNVTNHNFSSMTTSSSILINHVSCASGSDVVLDSENAMLDCSMYISSYPVPNYTWSVQPEIDAANVESLLKVRVSTLVQRQSVTFNCTAINGVVRQAASVLITVNTSRHSYSTQSELGFEHSTQCSLESMPFAERFYGGKKPSGMHQIVYAYIVSSVIIAIFPVASLLMYRKRKDLSAMRQRLMATLQTLRKPHNFIDDEREMYTMVDNDLYSQVRTHHSDDAEQHLCDREATTVEDICSERLTVPICDSEEHQYEEVRRDSSSVQYFPCSSSDVPTQVKTVPEPDEKDFIEKKAISARLEIM